MRTGPAFRLAAAALCCAALAACTLHPQDPGGPLVEPGFDLGSAAANSAVIAARACVARGCSRDEALAAAERAALDTIIATGVTALDADGRYRPFINAALLGIELAMMKSAPPGGEPSDPAFEARVREAVIDGVRRADGR